MQFIFRRIGIHYQITARLSIIIKHNSGVVMKNIVTNIQRVLGLCLVLSISMAGVVQSQDILPPDDPADLQDLPLEFNMDTEEVNWEGFTFHEFLGVGLARIPNPHSSGINTSEYVLQYQKNGAEPWAGIFYNTDGVMELTEDSEFRLKIWSPRANIEALLKLEMRTAADVNTGDLFAEITTSGEWIELTWDISELMGDGFSAIAGAPLDRVVIIMDMAGGTGDGGEDWIWFMDDFTYDDGQGTSTERIDSAIPQAVALHQNYPNPFNPTTSIQFSLPESAHATLEVYNMLGQRVATLVNETLSAGTHSANFDASELSSGVYLYRLHAGNEVLTRKLTLVK